jgi:hypothetical protein
MSSTAIVRHPLTACDPLQVLSAESALVPRLMLVVRH